MDALELIAAVVAVIGTVGAVAAARLAWRFYLEARSLENSRPEGRGGKGG